MPGLSMHQHAWFKIVGLKSLGPKTVLPWRQFLSLYFVSGEALVPLPSMSGDLKAICIYTYVSFC